MAASEDVYIDSNYFIALFNPEDKLHASALKLAVQIKAAGLQVVLSNFIFLEIVTVLSLRRGRVLACTVGQNLQSDPGIRIIHMTEWLQQKAWELFQKVEYKNISFVDCSTIAVMQGEYITKLLTFDHTDFKKLQKYHRFAFYH